MMVTGGVVLGDNRVIVTGEDRSRATIGIPLHLLDSSGRIARSFGTTNERVDLEDPFARFRIIGAGSNGTIWSGRLNSYTLERYDTTGRKVASVSRDVDWFKAWTLPARGYIGVTRQNAELSALFERNDTLWVFVRVNEANWRPMPPVPFRGNKDMPWTPDSYMEKLFDTMVEVIHVPTRQLLATQQLPQHVISVSTAGYMFSYEEDAAGNPRYAVWRLIMRDR
jgi:hypothetical protein